MKQVDELIDRNILRRKLSAWRILTLLLIAAATFLFLAKPSDFDKTISYTQEHIARIKIDGVINFNQEILDSIKSIQQDNKIKAVVLHVNSPGGTVVGGESIYYALRELAESKPLVAFIEESATSAAYMVSLAADHIVAHRGSVTGSIGVLLESQEITELGKKVGINFENYKSSPLKASPSLYEKTSPESAAAIQDSINDIFNMFATMVNERRPTIKPRDMPFVNSGRVFTGSQAFELGLIDALGTENVALDWLYENKQIKANLKVRDYELIAPTKNWEQILNSASTTWNNLAALLKTKHSFISIF